MGYEESDRDDYEKLLAGDIALETPEKVRRTSQEQWFETWDRLEERDGFGVSKAADASPEGDNRCAVCRRGLVCVPAVDGECVGRGTAKREDVRGVSEHREQFGRRLEGLARERGETGPGESLDPIELAIRSGLHCPNGHWVCRDCLAHR